MTEVKSVVKSQENTEWGKNGIGVSDLDSLLTKLSKNEFSFLKHKNPDIPHLEHYQRTTRKCLESAIYEVQNRKRLFFLPTLVRLFKMMFPNAKYFQKA